jgi:hypothetical protein
VLIILVAALVGFSIFGGLVYRAVDVERVGQSEALTRFTTARALLTNQTPMLHVDSEGRLLAAPLRTSPGASAALKRFEVLAYKAADGRLVVADVPFWFFRLKRPAVQFAVRGTGLDLDRLQLTAARLTQHGPGLILDQTFQNGDRLLVWTE